MGEKFPHMTDFIVPRRGEAPPKAKLEEVTKKRLEALVAKANQNFAEAIARYAKEAARFDNVQVSTDERRQLTLLKLSLDLVTPADPKAAEELTTLAAKLEGADFRLTGGTPQQLAHGEEQQQRPEQMQRQIRADEARTTCDQNTHRKNHVRAMQAA